jgi:hypothetical protein
MALTLVRQKEAAKRAGISEKTSAHWLRHCHASHDLNRETPIHLLSQTLGHASVATTSKYLHAKPNDSSGLYLATPAGVWGWAVLVICLQVLEHLPTANRISATLFGQIIRF